MLANARSSVAALVVGALVVAAAARAGADEDRLRAAFVLNVAKYVEWPAGAFDGAGAPFVIGVIGDEGFRGELEGELGSTEVDGRAIEVRSVADAAAARNCQIVYAGRDQRSSARAIALELRGEPVLSVAEYDRFAHVGGMVAFEIRRGKIDFEISRSAADRGGLKVSSKLLRLASAVR